MKKESKASRDDTDGVDLTTFNWFDRFSIPQYERLVKEGHFTQEEADRYLLQRLELGLPMSFDELEPRPADEFEWLYAAGGPSVQHDGQMLELDDEQWRAQVYGGPGELKFYANGANGSHLFRELRKPWKGDEGVQWIATFKLPNAESIYARLSGSAPRFADALTAVRAETFSPESFAGLEWYRNQTDGWITALDGQELSISPWTRGSLEEGKIIQWSWELSLPEDSVQRRIAQLFSSSAFTGKQDTREAAVASAVKAHAQLKALCAELLGDSGFETGWKAGREELKAAIQAMQ